MIVKESSSSKTTVTTGTALGANVARKKLKVANTGASAAYLNYSGTAGSSTAFDEKIDSKATLTVENYCGELKVDVSVRFAEFT